VKNYFALRCFPTHFAPTVRTVDVNWRHSCTSGVPNNFVRRGSTNSVEDRGQKERGSGGGSHLVRGSEGSCNLVQEISFHIVKFPSFLVLKGTYDDNQFICHC